METQCVLLCVSARRFVRDPHPVVGCHCVFSLAVSVWTQDSPGLPSLFSLSFRSPPESEGLSTFEAHLVPSLFLDRPSIAASTSPGARP